MFKDYPLAPEKNDIQKEWLSNYCLEIANKHNATTATVSAKISAKFNEQK